MMMYLQNRTKTSVFSDFFRVLAIFLVVFSSCTGNTNRENQDEQTADTLQSETIQDSVALKIGSDTLHVEPGKSIGRFHLNDDVENVDLFDRLGKPDSGDAAMCKSWAMWYWTDSVRNTSNEFDVYSACDPTLDMRKSIQILRLSGAKFITDLGISNGSTRADIKEMFPSIVAMGEFVTPNGKAVFLIDEKETGIAFEFNTQEDSVVVSAVIVHQPGTRLTDSYLPFYTKKGP